jgi:hypothetical protein
MIRGYVPIRSMRNPHGPGLNSPKSGKRFARLEDAFKRSAAYWGERGEWYIVAAQTRDSDTIDRSNFAVLLEMLGGESDGVAVERASHWAVGWVEYLIVAPGNRQGLRTAIEAHSSYSDYPLLDESHHSEVEDTECRETWENCFNERERAEYLRKHLYTVKGFRELRAAVKGDWYEAANLLPCPSDLIC